MDKNLYLQIYSVRDQMEDPANHEKVFNALASYGYKGFQTAGAIADVDAYVAAANKAGLKVIGTHAPIEKLLDAEVAEELHAKLGTKYAGIGGLPGMWGNDFSPEYVNSSIDKLHKIVENLTSKGLIFTYHHHSIEFAKVRGERFIDILEREFKGTNFTFCLDTYWVANAGGDVREWLEKLAGRVHILHLKDKAVPVGTNDGVITELGNGNLNFKSIIKTAEDTGVKYLCYEQDNGFVKDSLDSAKRSADYFYSII